MAVFHLATHAFFKALLFLAAGSVIMGLHHNQDMSYMGGVRKYMPITYVTSLIGTLALVGTPFFSGFYSKDSIIEAVHLSNLSAAGWAYAAVVASSQRFTLSACCFWCFMAPNATTKCRTRMTPMMMGITRRMGASRTSRLGW